MMKTYRTKKYIMAAILVVALAIPAPLLIAPQRAHAIPVFDAANFAVNKISAAASFVIKAAEFVISKLTDALVIKEYILDPIADLAQKIIIRSITISIVNWINNGFEGSPAFVDDFGGFLLDVADQVAGEYLKEEAGLGFLCEPFRLDLQFSLSLNYFAGEKEDVCRLSDIADNVDGFFQDFSEGSWDDWFSVTANPHNNPYGSFLIAQTRLDARIRNAKGEEINLLGFGDGFFSIEICDDVEIDENGKEIEKCSIGTPGKLIENGLADVFGSGIRQLELADEFNIIINALIAQLIRETFTSPGGFKGLSQSYGGQPSYTDRLANTTNEELAPIRASLANDIGRFVKTETIFKANYESARNEVVLTRETLNAVGTCYLEKIAQDDLIPTFLTDEERETAFSRAAAATSTIATTIQPLENEVGGNIQSAQDNLVRLDSFNRTVQGTDSFGDIAEVTDELQSLHFTDGLHNEVAIAEAELRIDEIQEILDGTEAQEKLDICVEFPLEPDQSDD